MPSLQFVITDRMSLISPLNSNDRSIPLIIVDLCCHCWNFRTIYWGFMNPSWNRVAVPPGWELMPGLHKWFTNSGSGLCTLYIVHTDLQQSGETNTYCTVKRCSKNYVKGIDRSFKLRGEIRLIRSVMTNWRLGNFFMSF